jgi:hypothetical protein
MTPYGSVLPHLAEGRNLRKSEFSGLDTVVVTLRAVPVWFYISRQEMNAV